MLFKSLAVAAAIGGAVAQRPSNVSICDYYTTALLKNNTAANQATVLTLVVNTAIIGNYTMPNVGIAVPGILANGTVNGTMVSLLPYFSGALASTNTGGTVGRSVNFLDDGGAAPLLKNMPANGTTSNQYTLVTHLYSYFGTLLGCSMQNSTAYGAYMGSPSMYNVHKFMDLSYAEVTYFVEQVGLSAESFGVTKDDATAVGNELMAAFGYACSAPAVIIPYQPAELQAICIDPTCPKAPVNATCSSYAAAMEPGMSNATTSATMTSASGSSATGTATSSSSTASATKNAAVAVGMNMAAVVGGFAALLL